jgi:hypothetical protein
MGAAFMQMSHTLGLSRNLELDKTSRRNEVTEMPVDSKAEMMLSIFKDVWKSRIRIIIFK